MSALEDLIRLVPPPSTPAGAPFDDEWADEHEEPEPPRFYPSDGACAVTGPHEPFVITRYGGCSVHLDLGGAFGEPRRALLDELLAALPETVRKRISGAEARRSEELVRVRLRARRQAGAQGRAGLGEPPRRLHALKLARPHAFVPREQDEQLARAPHVLGLHHAVVEHHADRPAGETATTPGRVINIGGGNHTSVRCALDVLAGLAGRPLDVRYGERESGDVQDTGADTQRARDELGFDPRTSLEEGLAAVLDWVRERAEPRVRSLTAS